MNIYKLYAYEGSGDGWHSDNLAITNIGYVPRISVADGYEAHEVALKWVMQHKPRPCCWELVAVNEDDGSNGEIIASHYSDNCARATNITDSTMSYMRENADDSDWVRQQSDSAVLESEQREIREMRNG